MNIIIPMAGEGRRFSDEYDLPKPLIPVDGKSMVVRATACLPRANRLVFVCLNKHLKAYPIERELHKAYPDAEIVPIPGMTKGQACTCQQGIMRAGLSPSEPLLLANCDQDLVYDPAAFRQALDGGPDIVIWTFRHTPCARDNPKAYGWIDVGADGRVRRISPKVPISDDPWNDHCETGTFWFKTAKLFMDGMAAMYDHDTRTNNEYYVANVVAELISKGVDVRVFEVDRFVCWGNPNDLYDYNYWQGYFERRIK